MVDCPACGTTLEVSFDPAGAAQRRWLDRVRVELDGYLVSARLPTAGDLAGLPRPASPQELARLLLDRCIDEASYRGQRRGR